MTSWNDPAFTRIGDNQISLTTDEQMQVGRRTCTCILVSGRWEVNIDIIFTLRKNVYNMSRMNLSTNEVAFSR